MMLVLSAVAASSVWAEGDPTRRAERLEPLRLDAGTGFSVRRYEVLAGSFYRWRIESDGLEEYRLLAADLFRQSWIDRVVIEDKEVQPAGLYAVAFDDGGTIDIWFIPQRPGEYEFHVDGLAEQGFRGSFVVR